MRLSDLGTCPEAEDPPDHNVCFEGYDNVL